MPPITPQVILAKKAVETAHDLYKDHHSASSNAQAQLYEGMLPETAHELQTGKTHRTAIVAGGLVLGMITAGAIVKVGFDDAWNKGIDGIKAFVALAPHHEGVADVNTVLGHLSLPDYYPILDGYGTAAAEAQSDAHASFLQIPFTHKETHVKSATMFSVTLPNNYLVPHAVNIAKTDPETGAIVVDSHKKPIEEMRIEADITVNQNDGNSTRPTFQYNVASTKILDAGATEGVTLRAKNVLTGDDQARRIKALDNYVVANWGNQCRDTAFNVLNSALAQSITNTVESAVQLTEGLDSKATALLKEALNHKIILKFVNYTGDQVTASSVLLPELPIDSRQTLADGLGISKDEFSVTANDCTLSQSAQNDFKTILTHDRSELAPIIRVNQGLQEGKS